MADGAKPSASVRPALRRARRCVSRPHMTISNHCGRHTALVDNGRGHSFTTAMVEYCSWSGVPRSMENAEKWVKGEKGDGSGIHGVRSGRGGIARTRRMNEVAGTVAEIGRTPNAMPSRAQRTPGIVAEVLCRPDARTTPHRHPLLPMRRRGFRETSFFVHGLCASGCRRPARPTSSMLGLGKTTDNCIQIAHNGVSIQTPRHDSARPRRPRRTRVSPSRRWRRPGLKGSEYAADT